MAQFVETGELSQLQFAFRLFDLNGDGAFDVEELKQARCLYIERSIERDDIVILTLNLLLFAGFGFPTTGDSFERKPLQPHDGSRREAAGKLLGRPSEERPHRTVSTRTTPSIYSWWIRDVAQ